MLKKTGGAAHRLARRLSSASTDQSHNFINSRIARAVKGHELLLSAMYRPPKVPPPPPFVTVKGAFKRLGGPVLTRTFENEEIRLKVMRKSEIFKAESDNINEVDQIYVLVEITKPGQKLSMYFICAVYEDAVAVHLFTLEPQIANLDFIDVSRNSNFQALRDLRPTNGYKEKLQDALHGFIDERGINERLYTYLQTWRCVNYQYKLMFWHKTLVTFVEKNSQETPLQEQEAA